MHPKLVVDHRHRVRTHLACADRVVVGFGIVFDPVEQFVIGLDVHARTTTLVVLSAKGRRLAEKLQYLADEDVVILGLPRGGVPVAFEVAKKPPRDYYLVWKEGTVPDVVIEITSKKTMR
jgi:adenine/guanine phosphoribosyltransferase-like PRPP-binding protein